MITFKLSISGSPILYDTKQCNLTSLAKKRQVLDIEFVYKMVKDFVDCSEILKPIGFNIPVVSTRTNNTFSMSPCTSNYAHYTPFRS